jgi:hypothetical protein
MFVPLQAGLYLLKLHKDLQKFEVILEEVARSEEDGLAIKHMMVSTRKFFRQVRQPLTDWISEKRCINIQFVPQRSTLYLCYEDQPVQAFQENDRCLL